MPLSYLTALSTSATKRHKMLPIDEVPYLAIMQSNKKWTMPIQDWRSTLNQFSIKLGKRVTTRA